MVPDCQIERNIYSLSGYICDARDFSFRKNLLCQRSFIHLLENYLSFYDVGNIVTS